MAAAPDRGRISIHIGNLNYTTTAAELLEALGLRDNQASVMLPTSRSHVGRRMGFGFVSVEAEMVDHVLAFDGSEVKGRPVKVSLARQSDQSKPGRWQKAASSGAMATVTISKPMRGIPQDVLDGLQALRLRLEAKKQLQSDKEEAVPAGPAAPPPPLVDVGANLTHYRFKSRIEEVVERSLSAGVNKIMVTGTSLVGSCAALSLAHSLPGVLYATAGVHPHDAKHWDRSCLESLEAMLADPAVVAVGETGLDWNRQFSTQDQQLEAFSAQVELACKLGKPLFLHEREAHTSLLRVLARFEGRLPPVLIHCFTGTEAEAAKYVELGFFVGVTGFVCKRERGGELRELLKKGAVPLARLVLETDSPFMIPPLPSRGYAGLDQRSRDNEPCTLPLVAKAVAELYGVSEIEVAERTTANAVGLFRL